MENKRKHNLLAAAACIAVTEGAGLLSALLSGNIAESYRMLTQPPLSPPGWLFGIVWPVLYALMGIALYLVYRSKVSARDSALFWFWVQLAVNICWPIVFFRFGLLWAAVAVILALDVLVAAVIRLFRRADRRGEWLLAPYLLWILFATYLNIGVAVLN